VTHTITLVTDVYVSKQEALHELSGVLGDPVNDSDPSNEVLDLDGGVVLSIEVPKFGEDLPLTVDLTCDDPDVLTTVTDHVMAAMSGDLSWSASVVGGQ
jgi:hypothetical protein